MKASVKFFPHKLFSMLEYASDSQWSAVISWSASGEEFDIKDRDRLHDILPMFFNSAKFKSFTRQLNLWGFVRIHRDADRWRHKSFRRGEPHRLGDIEYVKVKGPPKIKVRRLAFRAKAKEDGSIADRLALKASQSTVSTAGTNVADANDASGAATGGRDAPRPRPEAWSFPDSRKKPRPAEAGHQSPRDLREDSWEDPSVSHYLGDIIGGPPVCPVQPKVLRGTPITPSGGNSCVGARAPGTDEVTGASDTKQLLRQSLESGTPMQREDEEEVLLLSLILSL